MSNFKKGDRIRLKPGVVIFQATSENVGVVLGCSMEYNNDIWHGVEFDENIGGHDCATTEKGMGRLYYCAWVPEHCMTKILPILNVKTWLSKNKI